MIVVFSIGEVSAHKNAINSIATNDTCIFTASRSVSVSVCVCVSISCRDGRIQIGIKFILCCMIYGGGVHNRVFFSLVVGRPCFMVVF